MALMKTKSVSFNIEDGKQKELLEWVSKQTGYGFSDYIKALITHDMMRRKKAPATGQGIQIKLT